MSCSHSGLPWWRRAGRLFAHALAATLALAGAAAQAQLIDEIEGRRDGADAVMHIRFVAPVQFQRAVAGRSDDQTAVFYRVLPTREVLIDSPSQRRLPAGASGSRLPAITVNDEPAPGYNEGDRRLVVRLGSPVKHRARAGRDPRTIEVVLEGLGPALQPAPASELPAEQQGQLRVTLHASTDAAGALPAAIPAALQNVNVFTTRRVVNGQAVVETHLGPFATRAEAESALRVVRGRFPSAAITSEAAPAAPMVVAAAPAPAPPPAAAPLPPPPPPPAPPAAASAAAQPAPAPAASEPAAPAPPAAPLPLPAPSVALPVPVDGDIEARAAALLSSAREAQASGAVQTAIDNLGRLLDLPPNGSSRAAQALIGALRLQQGDTGRARAEFEAFLRLYPQGPDSDRVRVQLAALAAPAAAPKMAAGAPRAVATVAGSVSSTYYGGQSKVRTQEFQESAIGGLPQLVSEATLSGTDQSQLATAVDLNWRHRDADADQRFVFRDTATRDFQRPDKSRNRLSALYYDHRSFGLGTQVRLGRQTPQGGGVLGRFDGVQASYSFLPRWKAGVVAGVPADKLLDSRRQFYGASVDTEALLPRLGAQLYGLQQTIDGQVDRRALGSELRYFNDGLSLSTQFDYDLLLKGVNIAAVQGTWQRPDNTVFNLLLDRRKTPLLMLGNALFFNAGAAARLNDLLDAGATVDSLRQQVRATTTNTTQASFGVTTPVSPRWQMGADVRYTNIGAIAPVPDLLPQGQPSSGDIWSVSVQFIGSNLYSVRDTHVFIANFLTGPNFQGQLLSYNHSSLLLPGLQVDPSLKIYRQVSSDNVTSTRWAPGLRLIWRVQQEIALESEVSVESSKTRSALRNESSTRTFYYVGGRYDF